MNTPASKPLAAATHWPLPDEPPAPGLVFVFEIRADVGQALPAGPGALGERVHIIIQGGEVRGPRLNGRILPGGSDWLLRRPDGQSIINAHYSIQADDGTLIYVQNKGLRVSTPEVAARLSRGEAVAPEEVYFRTAPVFDAPTGPHGWLTDHLFVARASRAGDQIRVRVHQVT